MGAWNAGEVANITISANIWLHRVLYMLGAANAINSGVTDYGDLSTLVAGKWQFIDGGRRRRSVRIKLLVSGSLLMAGDDEEVYACSLNVTPTTTEQYLIVRSGKSEA